MRNLTTRFKALKTYFPLQYNGLVPFRPANVFNNNQNVKLRRGKNKRPHFLGEVLVSRKSAGYSMESCTASSASFFGARDIPKSLTPGMFITSSGFRDSSRLKS